MHAHPIKQAENVKIQHGFIHFRDINHLIVNLQSP